MIITTAAPALVIMRISGDWRIFIEGLKNLRYRPDLVSVFMKFEAYSVVTL